MYVISEAGLIFILDFMNFLLHAFIPFMIKPPIFNFSLEDSNHGILLIETCGKILMRDGEFLSAGISD